MVQTASVGGRVVREYSAKVTAQLLFAAYKKDGLKYVVGNHPDYKGCFLAEDNVLGVRAVGDTPTEALDYLIDCVDQHVDAVLSTENDSAIMRLLIEPLAQRER